VHGIELFSLMLGDFEHFDGEDAKSIFLELFDNVADCILGDGVGFYDGKSALQGFHWSLVVRPWL
jgi:hypothetical protein